MIMFFRRLGESLFFKVILFCIALSMVSFWGISDLADRITQTDTMIRVGDEKIGRLRLYREFQKDVQKYRELAGNMPLSDEQAVSLGLLEKTIVRLVGESVRRQMSDKLKTTATDKAVAAYILRNPAFQNQDGKFDRALLMFYLQQNNLSEGEFVEALKQQLAQRHLFDAAKTARRIPTELIDRFYLYSGETRDVSYAEITADSLKVTEKPTQEDITNYYDSMRENLIYPENRSVKYIQITPTAVEPFVKVSFDEAESVLEERKESMIEPEQRRVRQILVQDMAKAEEIAKTLTADNFQAKAEEVGQTAEETNFGWVEQDAFLETLSEPVFAAQVNQIIGPVETEVGVHLMIVDEIKEAVVPPTSELRQTIIADLKKEKSYKEADALRVKAENLMALGKTLEDISAETGLEIKEKNNLKIDGEKEGLFADTMLMQEIFMTPAGNLLRPVEADGGMIVAEVTDIQPLRYKTEQEAKEDILTAFTSDKQKELLHKKAEELKEVLIEDKTLADLHMADIKTEKSVGRQSTDIFDKDTLDQIFKSEKTILIENPEKLTLIRTDKVRMPKKEDKLSFNSFKKELENLMTADREAEMITFYTEDLGVEIAYEEIAELFKQK